jgi:hypothetical protein
MTVPFRIREAGLEDNDRLIELARHCPSRGRLDMYSDRYPDFFAMTRQQGERSHVWVAESLQGDLVASAIFIERSEELDGRTIKVLHFGDLRIHPAVRRTRVSAKMIQIYSDLLKRGNFQRGVVEILKSNAAPSRANTLLRNEMHIQSEAHVTMFKLFPIFNYKISKDWTYRQASERDLPALSKLLQDSYKNTRGAPNFSLEWLVAATQKHSSFNLSHILLAINHSGEISACLGLWDQSALRKTIVLRYSRILKFFVRLLALLGFLWKLPPLPKAGRSLHFSYLRWMAFRADEPLAMKSLLRYALRKTRDDGTKQFLVVGMSEGDRLRPALSGILKLKEPVHIYSHYPKEVFRLKHAAVRSALEDEAEVVKKRKPSLPHKNYIDLALI